MALGAAVAMLLLQTSIGAANDVLDVGHDRVARPEKPIPSGRVSRRAALAWAILAAVGGLGLAALLSPLAAFVALAGLACGLAYDAWLSRTALSFVPFAIGIPLLPVFAWAAVRGAPPAAAGELVVLGPLAGAVLALGNGLVDFDDDAAAGSGGLALRLGRTRALALLAAGTLLLVIAGVVIVAARPALAPAAVLAILAVLMAAGTAALASPIAATRERGWEAQAIAVALLAVVWLSAAIPRLFG